MKALHRTIAGGAFGVLAAATVAASAAYACHPKASVVFSTYNPMPGQQVRVQGNGFDAGETVKIWFGTNSDALVELGRVHAAEVMAGRPQADLVVQIPETAAWGTYLLGATQEGEKNPGLFRATVRVGPIPSAETGEQSPAPQPTIPPPPVVAPPQNVSAGGTAAVAPPAGVVPAPAVVGTAPQAADASVAAPTAGGAPLQDRQTKVVPDGVTTPVPLPFEAPGAPAAENLWSGLEASQVPALLDAPAPLPERGSAAVGVLLLGFGAAMLAGIGFVVGRRRVALVAHR